ncbi:MAG TPA: gamma-glutamyltransferase [Bacteroidales bacterium]|nr:gamma-glutamyltransferase [Bacteroidales bacterium]
MMIKRIIPLFSLILFWGCKGSSTPQVLINREGRNIIADSGMVVSAHSESSRIGVEILRKGGNAVDAAVATEFALAVCYPEAGNIGGGGFMIYRDPSGRTDMVDYREKAPLKAHRDMFLDPEGSVVPGLSTDTRLASGVPGTVDGMINIHGKYGLLSFRDVIQPAIDLARNGFPLTDEQATDLNGFRQKFIDRNSILPAFVRNDPWKAGDTLKQPELAETLERIRDSGREGFYSGKTASLIAGEMAKGNGIIGLKDLAEYQSVFRAPVEGFYRGFRIVSAPPPSGGAVILLQILGMVEPFQLKDMGFHSSASIHLLVEAEKRAYADRAEYLGDPDFNEIPVSRLLDQGYLRTRMEDFRENTATPSSEIRAGHPLRHETEETTHYSVVDPMGGAVAATTTLNGTFGSGIVIGGAGFLMNNQMDDFSLKPGTPNIYGLSGGSVNSVAGGKRMLSSMTPVILEKDGKLFMVAGSPGGSTIPTTVMQVITNVVDFDMDIANAVDAGRFHHQWLPDRIEYEKTAFDRFTENKLKEIGHTLRERESLGRVNAIMVMPDGRLKAGADRRGLNSAYGY